MATRSRKKNPPIEKIQVMLSSRNKDLIPDGNGEAVALGVVREQLKDELEHDRLYGHQILEVWINEDAGAENGTADIWNHCMERMDQADIVVVIYNGEAGWGTADGEVGICHGEMSWVLGRSPSKLRVVALSFPSDPKLGLIDPAEAAGKNAPNQRFQKDVTPLFVDQAKDRPTLVAAVKLAVVKSVVELAKAGGAEGRRGNYYIGAPLDWSRLSYQQRKREMERVMREYLTGVQRATGGAGPREPLWVTREGETLIVLTHAVPASFGTAEARELVGRPYLRDHEIALAEADSGAGPIHVIACHKTCGESQVSSFMGHPDLFIVKTPFGFFVADLVSFVQTFFLVSCRDESSTRVALKLMFDWITQSGELSRIATRGRSRRVILEAVAREIQKASQPQAH
jgi:hypothetical protein